jgi:hypothetical protein
MSRPGQSVGLGASLAALASPLSLLAIAVLLINDHLLKQLWSSALTGKLSDFAGLYFAPYVVLALLLSVPVREIRARPLAVGAAVYVAVAAVFAALKLSHLTAAPLLAVATALGFPVLIAADPTDLGALFVLPLSYGAWSARIRAPGIRPGRRLRIGALAVAALAMVATSGPPQPSVTSLAADPRSDAVYATVDYTSGSDGTYALDVADGTWRRLSPGGGELIADPRGTGSLYIVHDDSWAPTVERLTTDGQTTHASPPDPGPRPRSMNLYGPTVLAIAPWDPDVLFLGRNGRLLRSLDGGVNWSDIGAPGEVQDIAASAEKGLLYVLTNRSLYRSKDGGGRWTFMATVASASFAEPGGLAVYPRDPGIVLVGSRKELLRTTDGGTVLTTVYQDTGPGSADAGVWSVRFDPSDDDHVYALFGRGCCPLLESHDRGVTWSAAGIDATEVAIDGRGNVYAVSPSRDKVLRRVDNEWVDVTYSLPVQRSR